MFNNWSFSSDKIKEEKLYGGGSILSVSKASYPPIDNLKRLL